MKDIERTRRIVGFTLVELLVVIAIIGILIALLMPAIGAAFRRADTARARQDLASIVGAIKQYRSDYGKWPCQDNAVVADQTFSAAGGNAGAVNSQARVMNILRGIDTANNPKKTPYLDIPDESMSGTDKDGATYAKTDGYYLDPWGNPYVISMDTSFDNACKVDPVGPGSPDTNLVGRQVCAWSWGIKPGDESSVIVSW